MANRKRTSLDALISPADTEGESRPQAPPSNKARTAKAAGKSVARVATEVSGSKDEIVRQTLYLPLPVFDQLRELFFEEQRGQVKRRRMHDYFLESIDLLFKDRGLKSVEELIGKR